MYGFSTSDSLARFQPSCGYGVPDSAREKIREDVLNDTLTTVNKLGRGVRAAFDELIIELNPDCGPNWLDRIIRSFRGGPMADRADFDSLKMALTGLRAVA